MGICGSRPKGCVGMKGKLKLQRKPRIRKQKTRRIKKAHSSMNKNRIEPSDSKDLSYRHSEYSWFDTDGVIESDGEDEFYSVQDEVSQAGSLRFSNQVPCGNSTDSHLTYDDHQNEVKNPALLDKSSIQCEDENARLNETGSSFHNCGFISNATRRPCLACDECLDGKRKLSIIGGSSTRKRLLSLTPSFKWKEGQENPALLDKSSRLQCEDENARLNETGSSFHNCGFISNAMRPCLACDECLDGKRKLPILGGSSTRKRLLSLTPSFRWKEGQENPILSMAKPIIQRPIAGSQVMCSPLGKKMAECWSRVEPNIFKVRGRNYSITRDKKKEFAPNYSAYVPFGVDVFLSPRKINHVARHVELPAVDSHGEIPPILVVNLQIPLYQATIFQNEYDGAGMSFVFYFKLSENYSEDLPVHFRENYKKIIANETERIKGFPMDTNASFREKLKILSRVVNFDDLQLSAAERKLMNAYNEKPFLTRPQHEFYLGENYFEIDLDIHRFSYIARKGLETFQDRIKHCVFDFGLTIQGNTAEDLPECMLCCLRLNEIDYTKYCKLSV